MTNNNIFQADPNFCPVMNNSIQINSIDHDYENIQKGEIVFYTRHLLSAALQKYTILLSLENLYFMENQLLRYPPLHEKTLYKLRKSFNSLFYRLEKTAEPIADIIEILNNELKSKYNLTEEELAKITDSIITSNELLSKEIKRTR